MRAGDLADELGLERLAFKTDVRKLKALGLTESLPVGYRLSPRGQAWLDQLSDQRRTRRRPRRRSQLRLVSSSHVTASARRSVVAT